MKDNPENRYNHNFRGTYCICDRPYPDVEDKVPTLLYMCPTFWYTANYLR